MRWISLLRLDLHGWLSDQELPCRALGRKSVIESIPVGNCTAYLFLVSGRSLHTMQSRVGGLASFACFFFPLQGENLQLPSVWANVGTISYCKVSGVGTVQVCVHWHFIQWRSAPKSPDDRTCRLRAVFFPPGELSEQILPLYSCNGRASRLNGI